MPDNPVNPVILSNDPAMPKVAYNALILRHPFSGVEKSVAELARALVARKVFDYHLLLPPGDGANWGEVRVPRLPVPAWCRGRGLRILYELTLLPAQLRRAKIDLLHAPAYVAPPRLRCPLVLSLYDLHVYTHPRLCTWTNRLHYRARIPASIRRAAAILVPSQATRNALADRFPAAAAKTHIIPLGVAPAYFEPCPAAKLKEVRDRHRLPDRYLLFVGDLAPRKNIGGILQAWERLRTAHPGLALVLVGAPAGVAIADRPGILRTGYVAEADLPAIYAQARALLFPSFDEGFGLPVLEALAAGCPVVCSGGAAREFAADAARYCNPDDPADIAGQILPLLADSAFRDAQIARGRRQAARFTWANTAAATEAVYRQVLAGG
jgi:glycosyltransferase involved in cell wall biosynthesis